ncbi:MAG: thioesterase family protein, partial [Pseudomonadota bacterium]
DCDAAGIVFYPHYYRWMDAHFHVFTMALGFDQRRLAAEFGIHGTPLRQTSCTFEAPASFGDTLTITSRLKTLGTTSLSLTYRFARDGVPIAEGFEARVMVSRSGEGIVKAVIPGPIRDALAEHLDEE